MAPSVLGKRSRATVDSLDADRTPNTRAKRRAQQFVVLDNSKQENPFVTPLSKKLNAQQNDSMDVDEGVEESTSAKKLRIIGATPAKHKSAISQSPAKIDVLFKSTKPISYSVGKSAYLKTPTTPRHRDALATKVAVTPRHRVLVPGKPLTPHTPRTPLTPRSAAIPTIYNEARQVFSKGSGITSLYGREAEREELHSFIAKKADTHCSGCIYVSGPPGTGKSAFVNGICDELKQTKAIKTSYINCMSAKRATDVYTKLAEDFLEGVEDVEEESASQAFQALFSTAGKSHVVILDEIDYLLDIDLELLYNLFEWSLQKGTNLILIGIANALDFTDRFLPRLKARGLKPHLLPFLPYTGIQMAAVITSKLKSLVPADSGNPNHVPFIHPTAIQFVSKKVASQSGDLRKTFDICRRAIDLIEAETRIKHVKMASEATASPTASPSKTPLVENINLSSPANRPPMNSISSTLSSTQTLAELTAITAPRATIAHMARITAAVFSNGSTQRLQSLNLQQKAVLCALSALENKSRGAATTLNEALASTPTSKQAAPTIKQVYEAYTQHCRANNLLHPLTATEFRDIISSLETLSLISAVEGKAGSLTAAATPSRRGRGGFGGTTVEDRRIASVVSKKELGTAFTGAGSTILKSILEGED